MCSPTPATPTATQASWHLTTRRRHAPSKRALSDIAITEVLADYYEPDEHGRRRPECLCVATKMWSHLNESDGITVPAAPWSG